MMCLLLALGTAGSGAFGQTASTLGPGDEVSLRVIAWDTLAQEFRRYNVLDGTYTVTQDGTLSIPLLPPFQVQAQQLEILAEQIGTAYQLRLGLPEPPTAQLEIVARPPIFVLGEVARPGRYEIEPGLTPLRAVALAGGQIRLADASVAFRAAAQLREIELDIARNRMRALRLASEINGSDTFNSTALPSHPDGPASAEALFATEQALFVERKSRLANELDGIANRRALLESEIEALTGKQENLAEQVELVRRSLRELESLRDRGLARSPAVLNLQGTLIDLEARALDGETNIFRALQNRAELDRDESDLISARRIEILRDQQNTKAEIERLEARLIATTALSVGAFPARSGPGVEGLRYQVMRRQDGEQVTLDATESTPLLPQDVLIVLAPMLEN